MSNNNSGKENPLVKLLKLSFGLLCFFSFASLLSTWWWRFELFSHWCYHYTLLFLPGLFYFGWKRKFIPLAIGLIFVCWGLWQIVPLYQNPILLGRAAEENDKGLRILLFNVDSDLFLQERDHKSLEFDPFKAVVNEYDPHILALNEFFAKWAKGIESIRARYPHGLFDSTSKLVGPAIWSKIPLTSCEAKKFGTVSVHSMVATLQMGEKDVTLLVTHALPPIKKVLFQARNAQFAEMVKKRDHMGKSLIVCGDFNSTTFSPYLRNFCQDMGLYDARAGFGLQATWPTFFPPLAITIDHFFLSPDLQVKKYEVGPRLSSDHYPVIIDLALRPN